MYGSAHNVFAQTFAGKGLVGLAALCWLLLEMSRAGWQRARGATPSTPLTLDVGGRIVLVATLALALYGVVQEVFYIPALLLLVFMIVGLAAGLDAGRGIPRRMTPGIVACALAVALGAHLVHVYGFPGRLREAYVDRDLSRTGARLSPPEVDADGHYFQWTGEHTLITVPHRAAHFIAELRSVAPFTQTVELRFDGRLIDRLTLHDHAWRIVRYVMPRGRSQDPRRLELVVSPPRETGTASLRGVMIRRIDWGMPER